jgi:ketosteroid isomerase-like protein
MNGDFFRHQIFTFIKSIVMEKYFYTLICLIIFSFNAKAQTAEDSVKAVINKMFDAMKNADSKSLVECFTDSAILQTVVEKNGNVSVQTDVVKTFADEIGTLQKGDADERITYDVVRTDGALAIAWTPYNFYYKGQFSHCGVDSYQLVRINGEWKIQYLIDTRRKQGCTQ